MHFIKGVPLFILLAASFSTAQIDTSTRELSRDIFKQLIEINTTDSVGNVTTAAAAMAKRLRAAGFAESDMALLGPNARKITWSCGCVAADGTSRCC